MHCLLLDDKPHGPTLVGLPTAPCPTKFKPDSSWLGSSQRTEQKKHLNLWQCCPLHSRPGQSHMIDIRSRLHHVADKGDPAGGLPWHTQQQAHHCLLQDDMSGGDDQQVQAWRARSQPRRQPDTQHSAAYKIAQQDPKQTKQSLSWCWKSHARMCCRQIALGAPVLCIYFVTAVLHVLRAQLSCVIAAWLKWAQEQSGYENLGSRTGMALSLQSSAQSCPLQCVHVCLLKMLVM